MRAYQMAQHQQKTWSDLSADDADMTTDEVFEKWHAKNRFQLKRPDFYEDYYRRHIRSALGSTPIADVNRQICRSLIQSAIDRRTYSAARHIQATLSAMFSFAANDIECIDTHPIKGMPPMVGAKMTPSRDRVLSDEELGTYVSAPWAMPVTTAVSGVQLCLSTLQRRGEVSALC